MKKNKIILLTHNFPFEKGESFIETEMKYAKGDIFVISLAKKRELSMGYLNMDMRIRHFQTKINILGIFKTTILLLFKKYFWVEIKYLIKDRKTDIKKKMLYFKSIFSFSFRSNKLQKYIYKYIKQYKWKKIILYSYWLSLTAYSVCEIKRKYRMKSIITISRAHRYELYTEVGGYFPFRKCMVKHINYICFISEHGRKYFSNKYNVDNKKLKLFYLGVEKTQFIDIKVNNELKIITCSYIKKVKRLDVLIEALSKLDIKVKWVHIGDGENIKYVNYIKQYAKEKLSYKKGIKYKFIGPLSNKEVLKYYKEHYFDLFINTSSSEGLPVSIMEAMSFGIPAIGGNINGIPEIIEHRRNGFLFDKNAKAEDIAKLIEKYYNLSYKEKRQMRVNAYNTWKNKFNAEKNYKKFYKFLNKL